MEYVSGSANQPMVALRAKGIFVLSNMSRQIPGVDEAQSRLFSDFRGAQKRFYVRVVMIGHLVILVKRSDVPGNISRYTRDKPRRIPQFLI